MKKRNKFPENNFLLHDDLNWLKRRGYKKRFDEKNKSIRHFNLSWLKIDGYTSLKLPEFFFRIDLTENLHLTIYQQMQMIRENCRFYERAYILLSIMYIALSAFLLQFIY